jgi:hypothetical protein
MAAGHLLVEAEVFFARAPERMLRTSFEEGPSRYRAGEIVQQSGIYRVYHRAHRLPHNLYVVAGMPLPPCLRCGRDVEFGLLMSGAELHSDQDFRDQKRAVA